MSEIFPQDIEDAVLTRLKDGTNGLRALLTTINTTRSQSTPLVINDNITTEMSDQNPDVIVDYEESTINDYFVGADDFDSLRKSCTLTVSAYITSSKLDDLKNWISNYVEAITKCLHKYSTGNITAIFASEDIIADLYKDEVETTKVGGVRFNILINGGAE
jgi:hypothetical protein